MALVLKRREHFLLIVIFIHTTISSLFATLSNSDIRVLFSNNYANKCNSSYQGLRALKHQLNAEEICTWRSFLSLKNFRFTKYLLFKLITGVYD